MSAYKLTDEIEKSIVSEYLEKSTITLRELSAKYNIHHVTISTCLKKNNVQIRRTGAKIGHVVKSSTKIKLSLSSKGNTNSKGHTQSTTTKLKLIAHNTGLSYEFIKSFENSNKLSLIYSWINDRTLIDQTVENKQKFILHFYNDRHFNSIYDKWVNSNNSAYKPSIDHMIPFSRGGSSDLSNLRVITWFENRAKGNMTQIEWKEFQKVNNLKCDLFR